MKSLSCVSFSEGVIKTKGVIDRVEFDFWRYLFKTSLLSTLKYKDNVYNEMQVYLFKFFLL